MVTSTHTHKKMQFFNSMLKAVGIVREACRVAVIGSDASGADLLTRRLTSTIDEAIITFTRAQMRAPGFPTLYDAVILVVHSACTDAHEQDREYLETAYETMRLPVLVLFNKSDLDDAISVDTLLRFFKDASYQRASTTSRAVHMEPCCALVNPLEENVEEAVWWLHSKVIEL